MSRPPKLSKEVKRRMEREAAEEFFSRRNRPPTQFRSLETEETPAQPAPATDLPKPGAVLDINDSKEILRRLASGDIKQVRRR